MSLNRILICLLDQAIEDCAYVLAAKGTGLLGRTPVGEPVERFLGGNDLGSNLMHLGQTVLQRRIEDHCLSAAGIQLGIVRGHLSAVGNAKPVDLVLAKRLP